MSRAAERTTRKLTDQQLAQQNQLISQTNQQGTLDRSLMMPTIQSLLTSQGFTPEQQSAITQQSLGAANTAFDALRERAANRAAATNTPPASATSSRRSDASRRAPTPTSRSRIKSPSPTASCRSASPVSTRSARPTASTPISSAAPWHSRRTARRSPERFAWRLQLQPGPRPLQYLAWLLAAQ
jgi:hypothetical protein